MEYQNKSLRKAFEIIESLCAKPMTATELSKKLNLNPSTLHRFLANLEAMGYTEKLKNNQVRLTQQFIQLGKMAQAHYDVDAEGSSMISRKGTRISGRSAGLE